MENLPCLQVAPAPPPPFYPRTADDKREWLTEQISPKIRRRKGKGKIGGGRWDKVQGGKIMQAFNFSLPLLPKKINKRFYIVTNTLDVFKKPCSETQSLIALIR